MKRMTAAIALALALTLPLALGAGIPSPVRRAELLQGEWIVFPPQEQTKEGYLFAPSSTRIGEADFRSFLNLPTIKPQVNFELERDIGLHNVPSGRFDYTLHTSGVLTLSGKSTETFLLKYEERHLRSINSEKEQEAPYLCVFYNPLTRRAFKIVRAGEIGLDPGEPIFVPFQDLLTGEWQILPGQPLPGGWLDFGLVTDGFRPLPTLTVHTDNTVELTSGGHTAVFRLRQTDPSHWAILGRTGAGTVGRLTVESAAAGLLGTKALLTRWQFGPQTMTAVLRARASFVRPPVPRLRVENAQPLQFEPFASLFPAAAVASR